MSLLCLLGLLVVATYSLAAPNSISTTLRKEQLDAWEQFLRKVPIGESLQDFTKRLNAPMSPLGYQPLGGSGRIVWVFLVDDETQLIVPVNHNEKIDARPFVEEREEWLRFPDGTLAPTHRLRW